jgi:hypothetical protein
MPLRDLPMPPITDVPAPDGTVSKMQTWGNVRDAQDVYLETTPYTTRISDKAQQVRGDASYVVAQGVSKPTMAYVKAQVYDPREQSLNHAQRRKVLRGGFSPLSERLASLVSTMNLQADQRLFLPGYSMAGDVAVDATFRALTDANFAFPHKIDGIGIFDAARMVDRGNNAVARRMSVTHAFAESGKWLYQSILDSNSRALLQAHGADLGVVLGADTSKQFFRAVTHRGAARYRQDILGNWALMGGFGTDVSAQQLHELDAAGRIPPSLIVRMASSSMMPNASIAGFESRKVTTHVDGGDHSAGDNVVRAADLASRVVDLAALHA